MHHDAQRTMIGVAVGGMNVRNLHNRQQRKQNQADHCRHHKTSRSRAVIRVPFCLQSRQQTSLMPLEYTAI